MQSPNTKCIFFFHNCFNIMLSCVPFTVSMYALPYAVGNKAIKENKALQLNC